MPSWAHKEEVVEGLAGLIGIANLSALDAASAAQQVALPFAQRAQQLASQPGTAPLTSGDSQNTAIACPWRCCDWNGLGSGVCCTNLLVFALPTQEEIA